MANRFDAVRLAAALAVFTAHGVVLYQRTVVEPFRGHRAKQRRREGRG